MAGGVIAGEPLPLDEHAHLALRIGRERGAAVTGADLAAGRSGVVVHVEGVVIIEATIDRRGKVSETRLLRSIPLLDQAALDAVRQWEYDPTLLNGVAVPVIVTVTVTFTLR